MTLHPNQERLLKLLMNNVEEPLSVRKLMSELDVSSPGLVHHHISQLEKKGYLKRDSNNPGNYKVLQDPEAPVSFINLYGLAKCGPNGTLLSANPIDRIPMASKIIPFAVEEAFLVKADGDSMEPEIQEGDLLICKSQNIAEDGEIVVCTFNESVMIKRFRILETKQALLESVNPKYPPIVVNDLNDLYIEGRFLGLIRI